eukprot:gene30751-37155_t
MNELDGIRAKIEAIEAKIEATEANIGVTNTKIEATEAKLAEANTGKRTGPNLAYLTSVQNTLAGLHNTLAGLNNILAGLHNTRAEQQKTLNLLLLAQVSAQESGEDTPTDKVAENRGNLDAVAGSSEVAHLESEANKHSASDFAASLQNPFAGFGLSGHGFHFDPTLVDEDSRRTKLSELFGRDIATLRSNNNALFEFSYHQIGRSLVLYNDLSKVSETTKATLVSKDVGKVLYVQDHHLDKLGSKCVHTSTSRRAGMSLSQLGCSEGLAAHNSIPDGLLVDVKSVPRGIIEVKHGTDAPSEAIRQAGSEASNIAICHLKMGVNSDDVCVPVIGSNGYLIQFAAVILLKPSFPTMVVLSPVLDMTSEEGLLEATRLWCCVQLMMELSLVVPSQSAVITASTCRMILDTGLYHVKPLSTFFACTGNVQTSLHHYFRVMSRLHRDEQCRPYVLFPITVREYNDDAKQSSIVYPKLTDYNIGLPATADLRRQFLQQLKTAVAAFHHAGVAHLDLYLSNVMWRAGDLGLQIKVIDWDAAHFVDEPLYESAHERLSKAHPRKALCDISMVKDGVVSTAINVESEKIKHLDLSLLKVFECYLDDKRLQCSDKAGLDSNCKELQIEYYQDYHFVRK